MKKNISLLITLFIASTLLIAAKPLAKKTKPVDQIKNTQLNKVKPTRVGNVKKIVKDLNIPFIDIHTEVFKKEDNPLKLFPTWFEVETHYTVEGYKKVTEAVFKFLSNKKTLY